MRHFALALSLALAPTLACADEAWDSDTIGSIIYAQDIGDVAMFALTDAEVHLYLDGLAGHYENNGTYTGYWIENADGPCNRIVTGPDGWASTSWGILEITLDPTGEARSFRGRLGQCDGAYERNFYAWPQGFEEETPPETAPTK